MEDHIVHHIAFVLPHVNYFGRPVGTRDQKPCRGKTESSRRPLCFFIKSLLEKSSKHRYNKPVRTTVNLDIVTLSELKTLGHRGHKTFTTVMQEVVALGLQVLKRRGPATSPLRRWRPTNLGLKVDLTDKEALSKIFDKRP
jgi:hypothetical protein